jgi:TonB family protein
MLSLRSFITRLLVFPAALSSLSAQSHATDLIAGARAQLSAGHLDSAAVLLRTALDTTAHPTQDDRLNALVLSAILEFYRGNDSLTRQAFQQALAINPRISLPILSQLDPHLGEIFEAEQRTVTRSSSVYLANGVDEKPRRVSGPPVEYPPHFPHGRATGTVLVSVVVDTLGRVEPGSVQVIQTPDSTLIEPLKRMVLASQYTPGRLRGQAVRTFVGLSIQLSPPPLPNPTELVTAARSRLDARQADSALSLLRVALDSATHPSDGERAYALLTRGIAWSAMGRDGQANLDFADALRLYGGLTRRGVVLAPFLRRLADSVRLSRARHNSTMEPPAASGAIDAQPVLVSHPPIRFPPEMAQLGAVGTVVVEAMLDTAGHIETASLRVAQSANPGFNAEARRLVLGSVYRPARVGGRPVRTLIRQAITFVSY